ncbi:MaoC/PaaZ C-terminal domain-containing protein [Galbitalea soli]|uniref:Dehydratase n=1 Tax=Galbitalea soli TaxID=1268042 RepID=A0A7C9PN15_9MICO|nr:MaoC/PaaZ C-terminal domain-containing protein [Galbitalea soli]NEM91089.1 dehydratase [Galbitalea soli]NYJ29777.1 acyl dehydratase [Galbitalea soli]
MDSIAPDEFDTRPLGKWSEPSEFVVDRERLIAYAHATNDTAPVHLSGDIASPVFNVVPAFKVVAPLTLNMPPVDKRMLGVHGEQDFRFHRPIEAGMTLVTRAIPVGITPRSTGSLITVRAETTTSGGEPVVDQHVTVFIRTAIAPEAIGEQPPTREYSREAEPFVEVTEAFDLDQSYRYMGASGDTMPLHSENAFAQQHGFPGIILHGNCTFAFATRAVLEHAAGGETRRIKRLAVRFSRWVTPYDVITTRVFRAGSTGGRSIFSFETALADGTLCLSDGLVEVED